MNSVLVEGLSITANVAQIISVVWLLILGAKTIPDIVRRKTNPPMSEAENGSTDAPTLEDRQGAKKARGMLQIQDVRGWVKTGYWILFLSSALWFFSRISSCRTLSWYEILIIGSIVGVVVASIMFFERSPLYRYVGFVVLGPVAAYIAFLFFYGSPFLLSPTSGPSSCDSFVGQVIVILLASSIVTLVYTLFTMSP